MDCDSIVTWMDNCSVPFIRPFAALVDSCSNGSKILRFVVRVNPLGRYTFSFSCPMFGESILSLRKCDVAPESIVI